MTSSQKLTLVVVAAASVEAEEAVVAAPGGRPAPFAGSHVMLAGVGGREVCGIAKDLREVRLVCRDAVGRRGRDDILQSARFTTPQWV
jgi:hypothetical protein